MSLFIVGETRLWVDAILLGVGITLVYDCLRVIRRVFPHGIGWVSLEDFIYWIFVSVSIFYLLYYENNGAFRWFAVFGVLVGMLLVKYTVSSFLVRYLSRFLLWVKGLLGRIAGFLWKPFRLLGRAVKKRAVSGRRKIQRALRIFKKRLTVWMRMVKMVLCKRCRSIRRGSGNGKEKDRISPEEKRKQARNDDGHHHRCDAAGRGFHQGR